MPPTAAAERRFLRLGEVAARLGVSECRVRELIRQGRLPAVKLGDIPLIPARAVEEEAARRWERRIREREMRHLTPRERRVLKRRRALERALAAAEAQLEARRREAEEAARRLREAEDAARRLRERIQKLDTPHQKSIN